MSTKQRVYFAIRDDDTCYFTHPEELDSCYSGIWDTCPISLSVVPFHACTKSGAVPKKYWSGDKIFSLEDNQELVRFLRDGIARDRINITLHGYHHKDEPDGFEFAAGNDLARKVAEGKRYLEDLLGQPIKVFVPPHNTLGRTGYRAVLNAGLHISGIQPFRPSLRGYDPRITAIGIRRRIRARLTKHNQSCLIKFPDGHIEVPYHPLTPVTCPQSLLDNFNKTAQTGGVFCLATHYWEFDVPGRGQSYTIRQILGHLWKKVEHRDQMAFVTLSELCALKGT